jgi:hypothetical protein
MIEKRWQQTEKRGRQPRFGDARKNSVHATIDP